MPRQVHPRVAAAKWKIERAVQAGAVFGIGFFLSKAFGWSLDSLFTVLFIGAALVALYYSFTVYRFAKQPLNRSERARTQKARTQRRHHDEK